MQYTTESSLSSLKEQLKLDLERKYQAQYAAYIEQQENLDASLRKAVGSLHHSLAQEKEVLERTLQEDRSKLGSLGVFSFSKKKSIRVKIQNEELRLHQILTSLEKPSSSETVTIESQKARIKGEIEQLNTWKQDMERRISKACEEYGKRLEAYQLYKNPPQDTEVILLSNVSIDYTRFNSIKDEIEAYLRASTVEGLCGRIPSEIREAIPSLHDWSINVVSTLLRELEDEGAVMCLVDKGKRHFCIRDRESQTRTQKTKITVDNRGWDIDKEPVAPTVDTMDSYISNGNIPTGVPSQEEIISRILAVLSKKPDITLTDICWEDELLCLLDADYARRIMNILENNGKVKGYKEKGKKLYRLS